MKKPKFTFEQIKILDRYCNASKKKGYHLSNTQLQSAGISREKLRWHFGTLTKLKQLAKEYNPKSLESIVDESLFNRREFEKLVSTTEKYSRFVLSTAVTGCKVHEGFFNAIENYTKRQKALTLVLPCTDPAANLPFHLDSKLAKTKLIVDDLALNDNIFVSAIRLTAKHTDPVTGLGRIGQRNGSFIYASPKQRLKMIPTSNEKLPHAMMTTGALTKPNYKTDRYLSARTSYIAEHDHVLGAIIAEIVDDSLFHFRQVQADKQGNFIDLAIQYNSDGSTKQIRPEALVLGDWHSGETDPQAKLAFITSPQSVLNVTKPKRLIIHDGFNGRSISHHEVKNKILRAQRAIRNELNLADELEQYAKDLEKLCSYSFIEEVIICKSNHDEFLDRYLAEARYVEDAQNHLLALELAIDMIRDGKNPIKSFMDKRGLKGGNKVRWLDRDEDYKISGIELGAHGDKGANGARGSLMAMENAYGSSVSGHSHTPEILRNAWQVGTLSLLKLNYNQGMSSWLHSSCLVYPNGSRQLISSIDGSWKL